MSTNSTIDAIAFLTAQHRDVERLWSELETTRGTSSDPGDLGQEIVRLLSQHDAIETQLLYPELRDVGGEAGTRLSEHSLDEHRTVRELLKSVDGEDFRDERTMSTMAECMTAVQHHVQEEEGQIFPILAQRCDEQRLRELAQKMADMMKTAPTHPHPMTPDSKLGATVAGKVAGVADRARDAMRSDD